MNSKLLCTLNIYLNEAQFVASFESTSFLNWRCFVCTYVRMYCAVLNRLETPSDFHIPLPSIVPFVHS